MEYGLGAVVEDGFTVDFGHGLETGSVSSVPVKLFIKAIRIHLLPNQSLILAPTAPTTAT